MPNKAVIVGASGLIGSYLLNILLEGPEYQEVLALVRRELPIRHKKFVQAEIDFDKLDNYSTLINGHAMFSCLGTTQSKVADQSAYRRIDHDYPLQLAEIAKRNNMTQFHLVSSIGADPRSSNFYTRLKGEIEDDLKQVGLKCLHIYQPCVLTGDRKESRRMERFIIGVMKVIDPLLVGGLKKYRSIPSQTVARAMFNQSLKTEEGIFVHPSDKIKLLA